MTAPSAPRITNVRQNGGLVTVWWRPVDGATDYNVYLDSNPNPTLVEDSLVDDDVENGWMVWESTLQLGQVFIRIKALNALAEESAYSNEVYRYITSGTDDQQMVLQPGIDIYRRT